jgi:hypothetical protein
LFDRMIHALRANSASCGRFVRTARPADASCEQRVLRTTDVPLAFRQLG